MSSDRKNKALPALRHPDEFRAAAEATLGENLARWRASEHAAEEERERNPKVGQTMRDSSIFAGIDLGTGRKIFAAPEDANIQMNFKRAADYVREMNEKKYLGHDDWELPSRAALRTLYENRQRGALASTFQEAFSKARSAFYWSSIRHDSNNNAYGQWFTDGKQKGKFIANKLSVRLVRSPYQPSKK